MTKANIAQKNSLPMHGCFVANLVGTAPLVVEKIFTLSYM
jgi:hypothetical protein